MAQRPYVLLKVATSIDGYIDDTSPDRLLLSNPADFDRVDQVRAESDAILIGASTIRADNPRLLVNSEQLRADRVARGLPAYPMKVTLTATGNLGAEWKFWHHGGEKLVYTTDHGREILRDQLAGLAEVVTLGPEISDFGKILDDLGNRGIGRLLVEGGSQIHTTFLAQDLVDEINLVIAPIVVGQADAPRFLQPAEYPWPPTRRMRLLDTMRTGDVVLLRFAPKEVSAS
ncbi:MAG TPA: RibD family protein [Pseudonocardiaceae bacterium]|nr:RibD family protein [Pseudonocardiaceae bacterium]